MEEERINLTVSSIEEILGEVLDDHFGGTMMLPDGLKKQVSEHFLDVSREYMEENL